MLYSVFKVDDDESLGDIDLDLESPDDVIIDALIEAGFLDDGDGVDDYEIDDHVNGEMEGIIITNFETDEELIEVLTESQNEVADYDS